MPPAKTLLALVTDPFFAETFFLWEQKSQESLSGTEPNQLVQKLATAFFIELHKEPARPLIKLMQEGKLRAQHCQSWLQQFQNTSDSATIGPFPFHKKIALFLHDAIRLSNASFMASPYVQKKYHTKNTQAILAALQEDRLNATQLDAWMHNPAYDLNVIAQLAQQIKASDTPEQITLLEKQNVLGNLNVLETKISLANTLKNQWATMEKFFFINPTHTTLQDVKKQLAALDEHAKTLYPENIDAFITGHINQWLAQQEIDLELIIQHIQRSDSLSDSLTPQQKEKLTQDSWQQKISCTALLFLMEKGFTFKEAIEMIHSKVHQDKCYRAPMAYLRYLVETRKPNLKKDFDKGPPMAKRRRISSYE